MSVCMGVSHSLQASNETGKNYVVESVVDVEQLIVRFGASNQTTQSQLKQELTQSVESLAYDVKQLATAIVDVALSAVSYVLLSVAQVFASIVLDR